MRYRLSRVCHLCRIVCCAAAAALLAGEPLLASEESSADATSLADELPRIPPLSPEEALGSFRLEHGFRLELVASEPAVSDPVDACFDEDGRMYVAQMHGYPYSFEPRAQQPKGGGKQDAGIIRLLEDTNGDGVYDRSLVFADGISWPTSVCCYDGGVFVIAPPHLYYFKDTDGSGSADVREIVWSGFGRENVQSVANNLKWGLDNRIWAAAGRNSADLTHRDGETAVSLRGRDLRFNPATDEMRPASGGWQFGHAMDDWGRRFVCSNSDHIAHVVYPQEYLSRNPFFAAPAAVRSIAKEGGAGPVFRRSPPEPWRLVRTRRRASDPEFRRRLPESELVATGFFTSATGVTIYRGDAYPPEFRGNAFVGDVGGNLVHRKRLRPSGASFLAERADRDTEFITSTDRWFRPVNFVNAPDGTLYVLDMYRETIEHPVSIPEDIKAHLDLESGHDLGRIYRLVPPDGERRPPRKLGRATTAELVAQLDSPNAWNRETAQRLLWERQDQAAVGLLETLFRTSSFPLARLHALWTLDGLGALNVELLRAALADPEPGLREHAVRLAESRLEESNELVEALLSLADDASYRVRWQLALTLGELQGEAGLPALARLARSMGNDRDLRTAFFTSAGENADELVVRLLADAEFLPQPHAAGLAAELARMAALRPDPKGALRVLDVVAAHGGGPALDQALLNGLGQGLRRRGSSIAALLEAPEADSDTRRRVESLFTAAAETALDEARPLAERQGAAGLLAHARLESAAAVLEPLLSPAVPQPLQSAAVNALGAHGDSRVGEILAAAWRSYSPKVRGEALDALLARTERIEALFEAIASDEIRTAEIDRDKKQLLQNHPSDAVRTRARALFGEVAGDRAGVVAEYRSALSLEGDAGRGRDVYRKHCANCHRHEDQGHQVGPDLASVTNKSPEDLLIDVLDPSREAQPNFISYTVETTDGRILTGIIVAETDSSLTLRRAEGKEDEVLRSEIETLASNGVSLMPEGLEKEITPAEMADLIEFVRSVGGAGE